MARSRGFMLAMVALAFQLSGGLLDGIWHLTHHQGDASPAWVHLPIHVGIAVLVVAAVVWFASELPAPSTRVLTVLAGALLQLAGDGWSLAANAEEEGLYVPVALIVLGGAVTFGAALMPQLRHALRRTARVFKHTA